MSGPERFAHPCPTCGHPNDAAANVDGSPDRPDDGDVSICWTCGALAIFCRGPFGLSTRAPTPAERDELITRPDVRKGLAIRARMRGDL